MEINYTFYFLPFLKKWLKNYWHFVTGKTLKSVLVSCGARLAPFDIEEVRDITMYDELVAGYGGRWENGSFPYYERYRPDF